MRKERRSLRACRRALANAATSAEWQQLAEEHDRLTGLDEWRAEPQSEHYDSELLLADLRRMDTLRREGRVEEVVQLLHESLHRHLNDVLHPAHFGTALAGPKQLVSRWLDATESIIDSFVALDHPDWPAQRRLDGIQSAYRNLGRSALLLSGGATLGFYHIGVVRALWHANLLPSVIVGASMGALVASGICSRTDAEVDALYADPVPDIETIGLEWRAIGEALRTRSLMRPERMLKTILRNCGRYTFAEAYARSGRVLNISLMPTRKRQKPRILNHLTAPDVWIPTAALASSAVPGLFPPVTLTRRGHDGGDVPYIAGETWIDGSFGHDLPTMRVARLHNANHFIVSQTQPHALPMLAGMQGTGVMSLASEALSSTVRSQSLQALALARRFASRTRFSHAVDLAHGAIGQSIRGDINIHPRFDPRVYGKLLKNPTREDLAYFVREGERGTWPRLSRIDASTRINRALARVEKILQQAVANDAG